MWLRAHVPTLDDLRARVPTLEDVRTRAIMLQDFLLDHSMFVGILLYNVLISVLISLARGDMKSPFASVSLSLLLLEAVAGAVGIHMHVRRTHEIVSG